MLDILNEVQAHLDNWKVVDTSALQRAKKKLILLKIMSRRNSNIMDCSSMPWEENIPIQGMNTLKMKN
jgi:hypothetical protein